ncbi:MAG: hypothetical protein ABIH23_35175 [bacterium]
MPLYRNRRFPYDHSKHSLELVDYFCTHQPADWWNDDEARKKFAEIWGNDALIPLDNLGVVPENMDGIWVGGTYWQREIGRTVFIQETKEAKASDWPTPGDRIGDLERRVGALEITMYGPVQKS